MRKISAAVVTLFLIFVSTYFYFDAISRKQSTPIQPILSEDAFYTQKVQPLLAQRCIACHGCYSSPCQFNLQNIEGLARGAHKKDVYDPMRTKSTHPTRLGIDAHTPDEWMSLGFFDVANNGIFKSLLDLKRNNPFLYSKDVTTAEDFQRTCPANNDELKKYSEKYPFAGMPFSLPALSAQETQTLDRWISSGFKGHQTNINISKLAKSRLTDWEAFLNASDPEHKLVARYLYEHLFLAHIYLSEEPQNYYRLFRSRTACNFKPDIIATPRPNDDPKSDLFFYCFQPVTDIVVEKNNTPYEINKDKLTRVKKIFFEKPWKTSKTPDYSTEVSGNPFVAFADIPGKAKYQFLLDDAHYHISTFIKGPVCNGTVAVNSIQEQFYVFFLNPEADPLVQETDLGKKVQDMLLLPGVWGSDTPIVSAPSLEYQLTKNRNEYRKTRLEAAQNIRPKGYSLNDIWDGDKQNDNAVLTVMRHDRSAFVLKGARGDISKTVFVLDYALFERLVYNLVVNYDVFGNVAHQFLTRVYMALIRMEAEELFLQFLPQTTRDSLRSSWYQGPITRLKMMTIYPEISQNFENQISFLSKDPEINKKELIEKILFSHLNEKVRGPLDVINWKSYSNTITQKLNGNPHQKALRDMVEIKANELPFSNFFPDISFLVITNDDNSDIDLYSIIHHKQLKNIAWLFNEESRRSPEQDSLSILNGIAGSYPNLFLSVPTSKLKKFVADAKNISSTEDWNAFLMHYAVLKNNPLFWKYYDEIQKKLDQSEVYQSGVLDLTRYEGNPFISEGK